jgi:hypothetical protein
MQIKHCKQHHCGMENWCFHYAVSIAISYCSMRAENCMLAVNTTAQAHTAHTAVSTLLLLLLLLLPIGWGPELSQLL